MTEFVRLQRGWGESDRLAEEQRVRADRMEVEVFLRARELDEANRGLRAAPEELAAIHESEFRRADEALRVGRERAEEQYARLAAASEQQRRIYETALSNSPDFSYVFDLEGRFTFVNAPLLALWRKSLDEAVGKDFLGLDYPPELAARLQRQIGQVVDTGRPVRDETPFTSHLGERQYEYIFVPILGAGGAVEAVAGSTRDVTERKRAEEALRESEERFRASVDQAAVGVAIVGLDHRTTFANRGLCEMLGYTEAELLAMSFIDVTHPDDLELDFRRMPALLSGEVSSCRYEKRHLRKDGSVLWADLAVAAVRDGRGEVKYVVGVLVDITTQREARRDLEESVRRFRTLAGHAPVGIFQTDAQGHCGYVNERWCELAGLTPAEAMGRGWVAAIHEEDRRRVADEWYTAARSGTAFFSEFRFRTRSGLVSWIQSSAVALRNDEGEVVGHLGTNTDITEQKRLQEDLRSTKEFAERRAAELDAVVESMPDAVYFGTAEGLTKCNANALEMLGVSSLPDLRGDIADLSVRFQVRWPETGELLGPDELPFARALHGETTIQEVVIARAGGGEAVHVRVAAAPVVLNGEIVGAVAINSDITDRKRDEEDLREAARLKGELLDSLRDGEQRFRTMAESIPQLAWMARPDGHIYWYNRRWYEYTGTTPQQMEGWGWQSVHDPGLLPEVLGRWKGSIASGEPFDMVFPLKGADGEFRPFLTRVMPVKGDDGEVAHWFGTNTDISDRLRAEEELRTAKEEADAANRAKTQFLAVLSHELRTPLNPILLAVSSMLDRPSPAEDVRPALEMVRQNVNLQARLIDDLLDVMRIVQGKMPLHWGVSDCHTLIRRAVEICRSEVHGKGHRVVLDLSAGEHCVNADSARLQQVIWNLVKNAVKFTPEGGTITIRTRNEVGRDERIVIEVADTGIGIDPDVIPTIWDPFQQGETTITRRFGGLGLGLAICKGVVEAHGGTLTAESPCKDLGTTFRVVLKTMPDQEGRQCDPDEGRARPPSPTPSLNRLSILLVEDEVATLQLMSRLLGGLGHRVTSAETVADAWGKFQGGEFDLIISDIGLPDGSGLDLMRKVKASRRVVPAIALTGYGMDEDIRRSREAGFTTHMTKPIDFSKLEAMIRQVAN